MSQSRFVINIIAPTLIAMASLSAAHAEMVKIPWQTSTYSSPWIPGNDYIDGWSKNFMNGTIEEKRKIEVAGKLQAEMIKPKSSKDKIPFVLMLHGCSGIGEFRNSDYAIQLVRAGYGILLLDSFTTRGIGSDGVCSDPSQLELARRRAEDAYSALDWLIAQGVADSKHVYVLGRSNGATTTLIIMNRVLGDLHKNLFAGGYAMQPSCYLMKTVEFYAPVHLFLGEKDEATSPVLCGQMAGSNRAIPVQTILWKGAHHAFQDHYSIRMFHGYHVGYNRQAAEGTIKAIIARLNEITKPGR